MAFCVRIKLAVFARRLFQIIRTHTKKIDCMNERTPRLLQTSNSHRGNLDSERQ